MWRAFDNINTSEWAYATGVHPAWLQIQLPSAKTVTYCKVSTRQNTYANQSISAAVLQGSNDASAWTTLTNNINVSSTQNSFILAQSDVTSPASYLYYRLYITAAQGIGFSGTAQIELWGY